MTLPSYLQLVDYVKWAIEIMCNPFYNFPKKSNSSPLTYVIVSVKSWNIRTKNAFNMLSVITYILHNKFVVLSLKLNRNNQERNTSLHSVEN